MTVSVKHQVRDLILSSWMHRYWRMLLSCTRVRSLEFIVQQYYDNIFSIKYKDKQPYKTPDEIIKDPTVVDANISSAAIIKSASTPASLQTIVRFSNGSNMSLQHKVKQTQNDT